MRGPIAFSFYSKEEQIEKLLDESMTLEQALDEKNLLLAAYAKESAPSLYVRLKKKTRSWAFRPEIWRTALRASGQKEHLQKRISLVRSISMGLIPLGLLSRMAGS